MLVLLACAPPPYSGDTASSGDSGDTSPGISISWPFPDADVVGCTMMTFDVTDFTLVPASPAPMNFPGEGHIHVLFGTEYTMAYAPYCLVDLSAYPVGAYTLTAELEQNDHTPILDGNGEPIRDSVSVNLGVGACEASTSGLP